MVERDRQRETASGTPRRPQPRRRPDVGEAPADPERIRILAYEIYETRRASGMLGDPVSDWLEAERRLTEPAGARRTGSGRGTNDHTGSVPAARTSTGTSTRASTGTTTATTGTTTGSGTRKKPSGK